MGQRTKGDMWCEVCKRPVLGIKTTARARNTTATLTLGLTSGLSALAFKNEGYVCQECGGPVKWIPGIAHQWAHQRQEETRREAADRERAELRRLAAERYPGPEPPDWRELPEWQLPPWRLKDRERYEAEQRNAEAQPASGAEPHHDLTLQLRQLVELHASGALTDEEFAAAKRRILESD